jgi:glutathione reductase (NADPH)
MGDQLSGMLQRLKQRSDSMEYDLIVIGAGSGGVAMARRAALHGAKVAVIESGRVGGTCVIRGCVPKKFLMYAAQYGDAITEAAGYGWIGAAASGAVDAAAKPRFEMSIWAAAKAAETARLEGVYRDMLAKSGVELIAGRAQLAGPGRVTVETIPATITRSLSAPHIVVASGASPIRDSIPGIAGCAVSDDLLDLTALPHQAAIVGGGYIACEFASMLARLGISVTLLYRDRLPLRGFDDDMRRLVATALADAGVTLRPGAAPQRIEASNVANAAWTLHLPGGETLATEWVLNATGRRPNSAGIGLASVGVKTDAHAAVSVDNALNTSAPGVYAIGDVTNRANLTPVAIAEGRWLADRLFGASGAIALAPRDIPTAVFTLPPLANVGFSEGQALAQGLRIRVFEADFKPMRHAFSGRNERVAMKLIVDAASDRVIGLHMLGADSPEIVQCLAVAISAGATKADFDRTLAVHPTTAEEWVLMRTAARESGA